MAGTDRRKFVRPRSLGVPLSLYHKLVDVTKRPSEIAQ